MEGESLGGIFLLPTYSIYSFGASWRGRTLAAHPCRHPHNRHRCAGRIYKRALPSVFQENILNCHRVLTGLKILPEVSPRTNSRCTTGMLPIPSPLPPSSHPRPHLWGQVVSPFHLWLSAGCPWDVTSKVGGGRVEKHHPQWSVPWVVAQAGQSCHSWERPCKELCTEAWLGGHGSSVTDGLGLWAPCQPVGTVQGVFTGHPIPTVSRTNLKLAGVPTP